MIYEFFCCMPTRKLFTLFSVVFICSSCFMKHNILVLADEIYARLHFQNDHKSIAKYYPEGTILSSGISKWASAGGWRVLEYVRQRGTYSTPAMKLGYSLYPKRLAALRKAVASAASHTYSCAPAPVQYAALWLFTHDEESAEYMAHTRRILAAVAQYCHRKLEDVGVKVCSPTGGFYMFPDFEVLRDSLKQMGIETCHQMCKHLLDEKGIALMSGGPAFLRPDDELTVRFCFIDFIGTHALDESQKLGLNRPLPDDFVKDYCNSMYLAVNCLTSWVEETKKLIISK
ncbi:hypothetical protein HOLleu_20011 [Holothuria leucospilota]|uniref:Aminotransferase class I/classII large domain-containing protein n=1 Tax=Holothuria leucospilota TaxID=206669 RepID=A0A9Q1C0F5_HOLLE|nr:hypothetical protein HOLleu_20011 [Holothuria leucospilota]